MTRSPRDDFKPWARDLPTIVLRLLFLLMAPFYFALSAWEGGLRDGWREFSNEWRAAGAPRSKKDES